MSIFVCLVPVGCTAKFTFRIFEYAWWSPALSFAALFSLRTLRKTNFLFWNCRWLTFSSKSTMGSMIVHGVAGIEKQSSGGKCQRVYLHGWQYKMGKEHKTAEMNRRIGLIWVELRKLCDILKNRTIPVNLKRKVYESCIVPVATYGFETMTLTERRVSRLRTT